MNSIKINLMPKNSWKTKTLKGLSIIAQLSLVFNMCMVGVLITPKMVGAVDPVPDFSSITWSPYQINGHTVTDYEDNLCGINDSSKGPANVAPEPVDLASNAQAGPPCENPGSAATLQKGSDSNFFYFRIRLADTPISSGGGGKYLSYHWDVLIDTDGNHTSDYVVDLNGSGNLPGLNGSSHSGILGVYTNDPGAQTYDPANHIWQAEASATTDIYTHVIVTTENPNQYWLDFAVPKSQVPFTSYAALFASTSASNTDPLQKDWMASEAFFIDLVKTKSVQNLTHPGYTTVANPVRPGDTLRYTLTVTNNGNRTAPGFVVSDDVSDIVQYTNNPFNISNSGSYNSTTKFVSWPQTDIGPAITLTRTFDVTIKAYDQWPTADFMLSNVYGNNIDVKLCALQITKQVDKTTASVGDTLTYTINYTNVGKANCTGGGAEIYDALNSNLTFNGTHTQNVTGDTDGQGINWAGGFNGTNPLVHANVVSPGESGTITFEATINNPTVCGDFDIPNKAKIWSDETGDIWSNQVNTHVPMVCYGSLKVTKVIDSGSATADQWSFTLGATTKSPATGQNYVIFNNLLSNSYTVTESNLAGYHQVSTTCTNVNVVAGQQAECNFHNARDTGTITVNKKVDADGNGTFEGGNTEANALGFKWGLDAGANDKNMGASANNVFTGSHAINENSVSNYHFVGWYPTGSTQYSCSNPQGTTLPVDINVTYNQTTDITLCNAHDTGNLTVNKAVDTNGDGQIDQTNPAGWTYDIDAGNQNYAMGTTHTVITGSHAVSEDQHANYSATGWVCDNGTSGTGETLNVNVTNANVSCTFTNVRDMGWLLLKKHVVNDNGGNAQASDFNLHVKLGGTDVNGSPVAGTEAGTLYFLETDTYVVNEDTPLAGYTQTSIVCDGQATSSVGVTKGTTKTCTITNDDIAPTITLNKVVNNNHGGNAGVNDFGLTIGATSVTSGQTLNVNANTPIALNEAGLAGYNFVSLTGNAKCPSVLGGTVTLNEGENITCTITNEDVAPTITLNKVVNNNHGGNAGVNDFGLTIGATGVNSGQTLTVNSNTTYALNEAGLAGYNFVSLTGSGCPSNLGDTVNLDEGENVTCTITNEDEAPTITLIKNVINNNGGTAGINDFGLTIGATGVNSGQTLDVNSNTPYALNEAGLTGYSFVNITGDRKCPQALNGTVTLDEGEDITCTITNDDQTAHLTLIKQVTNDNGGQAVPTNWTLNAVGPTVISGPGGADSNVNAGTYTLSENVGPSGYSAGSWNCSGGSKDTWVLNQ